MLSHSEHMTDQGFMIGFNFIDRGDVFAGDDQYMHWSSRVDIVKCNDMFILVYLRAGADTINYLAEEEDLISIRPKDFDDRRVTLTQAEVSTLFYLVVIAIPLLVVIAGVIFYIRRGK